MTDNEIDTLEAMLADPVYADEDDISSWADDEVDAMSVAGIFCGDKDHKFNPQDSLKRSECVKIISAYIINEMKPTFYFPGGSYIEYLGTADAEDVTYTDDSTSFDMGVIDSFNRYGNPPDLETVLGDPGNYAAGNITTSWAKNTHQDVTAYAIQKIRIDRPYITNKMQSESFEYNYEQGRHTLNGAQAIWFYAYYADTIENQSGKFYSHFYEPVVGSYSRSYRDTNACMFFNNHFYNAYTNYRNGYKASSYKEMGMSIHYLEDMSNSYHASNLTNLDTDGRHGEYERWADNKMVSENYATYESVLGADIYSSYRYMYDNDFIVIANNTAGNAKNQYKCMQPL